MERITLAAVDFPACVRHAGDQRRRDQRPNAWNAIKPSTGLVVPGQNPPIGLEDLLVHQVQLHGEHLQAGSGGIGNPGILDTADGLQ